MSLLGAILLAIVIVAIGVLLGLVVHPLLAFICILAVLVLIAAVRGRGRGVRL